jgi:very-short-patch-repair endonuclease
MTRHRLDRVRTPTVAQVAVARQLRREGTPMERYTWGLLRNRRMLGLKFRRQHVLEGFIVDFYCATHRLVIELDGTPHDHPAQAAYDRARRGWLEQLGYRVVVIRNVDLTPATLEQTLRSLCVPPPPSGGGGQGERMVGRQGIVGPGQGMVGRQGEGIVGPQGQGMVGHRDR